MTGLDLFRLSGQTAVVVGGAGGLGAAMARGLAEAGAAVAVADADLGRAKLVADGLAKAGARALPLAVDVTDRGAVERMAAEAEDRLGPIDVLVNSAGITHRGPAAEFPEAEWHRVLAVNLTGVFWGCQVVGGRMLARGRGSIVNIASIAGQIGLSGTV
ncbi:MAG TPA: SDR family NAD(P)-dependent oxidoreductase, partial [Methylomirabilota bacterium]